MPLSSTFQGVRYIRASSPVPLAAGQEPPLYLFSSFPSPYDLVVYHFAKIRFCFIAEVYPMSCTSTLPIFPLLASVFPSFACSVTALCLQCLRPLFAALLQTMCSVTAKALQRHCHTFAASLQWVCSVTAKEVQKVCSVETLIHRRL